MNTNMNPEPNAPTGQQNTAQGCAAGATLGTDVPAPAPSPAPPGEPGEHHGEISQPDFHLPKVAGRRLRGSINDFERACLVHIERLQHSLRDYDDSMLGTFCEAVRLCREYDDSMNTRHTPTPPSDLTQLLNAVAGVVSHAATIEKYCGGPASSAVALLKMELEKYKHSPTDLTQKGEGE